MTMQKIVLTLIGILIIAAGAWYLYSSGTFEKFKKEPIDTSTIVAMVDGEEILRADFEALKTSAALQQGIDLASLDAEAQGQLDERVVDELIAQVLLRNAVNASDMSVSQEVLEAQVAATMEQVGGQEAFEEALVAEGLTEETFRTQVRSTLKTQAYLEEELGISSLAATEEEIEGAYAQAESQNESIPPLSEVHDQVEALVIQEKQQSLFTQFIQKLRERAKIEIFL